MKLTQFGSIGRYLDCGVAPLMSCALVAACGAAPAVGPDTNAPEAKATADSTWDAPPPASTIAAPAERESSPSAPRFRVVASAPTTARLFPVEGALLVSEYREPSAPENSGGNRVGVLEGETITYPDALFLDGWAHQIVSIQGSYPDALHLLSVGGMGRTGTAEHYTATVATGWQEEAARESSVYVGVARVGRALLGLTAAEIVGEPEFVLLEGKAMLPRFTRDDVCPADGEHMTMQSKVRVVPAGFTGTSNGDLVAFGSDCLGGAAFEIWKSGSRTSTIVSVPGQPAPGYPLDTRQFSAGIANDVWVLSHGASLYHYQNGTVTVVPMPLAQCSNVVATPNGGVSLLCEGKVFSRLEGHWVHETTEGDVLLDDLVASSDGTLWGVGGESLLRASAEVAVAVAPPPGAPPNATMAEPTPSIAEATMPLSATRTASITVPEAPPAESVAEATMPVSAMRTASITVPVLPEFAASPTGQARQAPGRRSQFTPGGPGCPNNLVVLYALTKTTPPDYDFPLTRKALLGHTEFSAVSFAVTVDGGRRFLSARVPSFAVGKRLQAVVAEKVAGSKPQILCAAPEIEREVTFEF